jgi:hypothetical protein
MKLITLLCLLSPFFAINSVAAASAGDWEVRRLKDGTCGVKKIKPGAKPGDRVGGPYISEAKARQNLQKLKTTPRCKRF